MNTSREQRYFSILTGAILAPGGVLSFFDTNPGYSVMTTNLPPGGKCPYPLAVKAISLKVFPGSSILGNQFSVQEFLTGLRFQIIRDTTDIVYDAPMFEFVENFPSMSEASSTVNNATPFVTQKNLPVNGDLVFNADNTIQAKLFYTGAIAFAINGLYYGVSIRGLTPLATK